jgi:hypothetical protein
MSEYKCKGRKGDFIEVAPPRVDYEYVDIALYEEGNRQRVNLSKPDAIAFAHDVLAAAGHVPEAAPRVVTGRDILRELNNVGVYLSHRGDTYVSDAMYAALDRAAARLTARAGATTNSASADSSVVVTETAAGIQTVPVAIVRRPVETTTALPMPWDRGVSRSTIIVAQCEPDMPCRLITAEQLSTYEAPVRWCLPGQAWVERTPVQTARAWTAGDCEACVGQRVMTVSDENVTNADHWKEGETAEHIATCFTGWGIEWYVVVPTLEVSP